MIGKPRRLTARDLFHEIIASLLHRPGRLALTASGTVLGIAALVATLGLAATAGSHIVTRFDELAATEVTVQSAERDGRQVVNVLDWDAQDRLERLNGVKAAGTISKVDIGKRKIRFLDLADPMAATLPETPVVSASPGLFPAVRATLGAGRWFDRGHSDRRSRVAVLGGSIARQLGIVSLDGGPAVFLGDDAFTVIGILAASQREPSLAASLIIPDGTAADLYGLERPERVYIDTAVGAADQIADEAPLALHPRAPDRLTALTPPEPALVRSKITGDVQALLVLLGGLSLIVGGFGIANTTLVSVMERRAEIALRRSLGAQRRQIAFQFLIESTAIGLLGGVIGASAGILITVGVSFVKTWTPVLDPALPFAGVAFGALIGVLAGAYPSFRASRLEPIEVLRGES